jgi:hypothetical protein
MPAHCHLGLGKLGRRRGDAAQAQEQLTIAMAMYREIDNGSLTGAGPDLPETA